MVVQAAAQQDRIGQQGFLDGHVSQLWGTAQDKLYHLESNNRRKGSTWSKRLVNSLYKLSRKMWNHRNKTLYKCCSDLISQKQRATILEQVKTELKIGKAGLHNKDIPTICFDGKQVHTWTTPTLDNWLKHVKQLC